jgi:hypothetical protein
MDHPAGAGFRRADRVDFDTRVRLEFRGAQISSDGSLLVMRELDDALGLSGLASAALCDNRRGKNTIHRLDGLFRQSVYGQVKPTLRMRSDEKTIKKSRNQRSLSESADRALCLPATASSGPSAVNDVWNALSAHQKRTYPFKLARLPTAPANLEFLARFSRVRREEIEGFVDGLFANKDEMDLLEWLSGGLAQSRDMFASR